MDIREIKPEDINEVQSWLDYRDPATIDVDLSCLPPTGMIAPGIAACWYTFANCPVMYVDTFVSNPHAELDKRREAGKLFHALLLKIAIHCDIKRVMFLTRNKAVMKYYAPLWHNVQDMGEYTLYRVDL